MILDNPYNHRGSTYRTGITAKKDLDYLNQEDHCFSYDANATNVTGLQKHFQCPVSGPLVESVTTNE